MGEVVQMKACPPHQWEDVEILGGIPAKHCRRCNMGHTIDTNEGADVERLRFEHARLLEVASAAVAVLAYEWKRSDGELIVPHDQKPWVALVEALEALPKGSAGSDV